MDEQPKTLIVCVNWRFQADQPSCAARGSEAIADALEAGIRARRIDVVLERICCLAVCEKGPNVRLVPGEDFRHGVALDDVPGILDDLERACGVREGETGPLAAGHVPGT